MTQVRLNTSLGAIVIELNTEKAPLSSENFLQYVKDGHYNGTVFHRVIPGFMIQGGGFTPDMQQKETRKPINNEARNGLRNEKYTVALARTAAPHSGTAQFFINVKANAFLDNPGQDGWGYAVFGEVVEGFTVVDAITGVTTSRQGMISDVPNEPVIIVTAEVVPDPEFGNSQEAQ